MHPAVMLEQGTEAADDLDRLASYAAIDYSAHEETIDLADHIFCASTAVIDSMVAHGVCQDKLIHIPYGVEFDLFSKPGSEQRTRSEDGFNILYVGRICRDKGVHVLLDAFQNLDVPGAHLTLIGKNIGDIDTLALENRSDVTFTGHIAPTAVASHYRKADVLVLPSFHEGAGRVVYEAMAAGLPVITTPVAADLVRDGLDGFVVPSGDVFALQEKLVQLAADSAICIHFGQSASARIRNFTWDVYRQAVVESLQSIMGQTVTA
jgi:glycosyltransferase involved in cell wall biosynthesis